jgi:hypothetical protein
MITNKYNPFDLGYYEGVDLKLDDMVHLATPEDWYNEFRTKYGFQSGDYAPDRAGQICDHMVSVLNAVFAQIGNGIKAYRTLCSDHDVFIEFAIPLTIPMHTLLDSHLKERAK